MIRRDLAPILRSLAQQNPVVAVTGPRQSGKTTLCRATFADLPYVSLEPLDNRQAAIEDPRGFLSEFSDGAIIDEVQRAPDLLSYLQAEVDENPEPGRFILTGSQNLGVSQQVSQSLAGRVGILCLLPPSWEELKRFPAGPSDLYDVLWQGSYPRIHDRKLDAHRWLRDYLATYVQRDVRQTLNVTDLNAFTAFLRLCAGRTSCPINLSGIGADVGVAHNTARSWISVLDASFISYRLPAWHANIRRQITKSPKLHFVDSGLLCHLLGIRGPDELAHHPLRGAIFESWVVSDVYKQLLHKGLTPDLFHYRDSRRLEVDLIVRTGAELLLTEIKSGQTIASDFFDGLDKLSSLLSGDDAPVNLRKRLVYGGDRPGKRTGAEVLPWSSIGTAQWD